MSETTPSSVAWDAATYHRVAQPQSSWGMKVLNRLELAGDETVADAGCGSGRLTAELLQRLPRGRVTAIDQSAEMLEQAARSLCDQGGDRVTFLNADLQDLRLPEPVDVIFSGATFHWVPDHARLFRALFRGLKPGGRLVAQCGGGPNIAQFRERAASLLTSPDFQEWSAGWHDPWYFSDPQTAANNLAAAGFEEIETSLEHTPVSFPDADAYREFIRSAVLPAHLATLPDDDVRQDYLERLVVMGADDEPPYALDYWRLNLSGRRPLAS